jgi:hypothetical protein
MSARPTTVTSHPRPARATFALACAATAVTLHAPRASAGLINFGDFAPVNSTVQDPTQTPGNGYYSDNTTFQITANGINGQATSGFASTRQAINNFVVQFTYLDAPGGGADGVAFVVQNDPRGTAALGTPGGAMGYRSENAAVPAVSPSVAAMLNIFNGGYGVATNGVAPTFFTTPGANIRGGYPVDVKLSYYGTTLTTTIRDGSTGRIHSRSDTVDIPAVLGAGTGYVGFTGATGGLSATQVVSNFKFDSTAGTYAPIAATGWNQDAIVEAGATSVPAAVTANLDNGTDTASGATFYEKGYVADNPNTGVAAGQTVASAADGAHTFKLGSATGMNAILLNTANTAASLALDEPAAYAALSFLTSTGNGSGSFNVRIIHADGDPDEVITGVAAPDWFNGGGAAILAGGRVHPNGGTDSVGSTNPRLYQSDVVLTDQDSPIAAIELTYNGGAGNTFVFALSGIAAGAPVPEPATAGALAVAATVALTRRRTKRR